MAKPLSAWELKEQVRRNAERRSRRIRQTGAIAATVLLFSVAGIFGLKASRTAAPATLSAGVVTQGENSQNNAPVAVVTPVPRGSGLLSLTGTSNLRSDSASIDSGDVSLGGTNISLVQSTPR